MIGIQKKKKDNLAHIHTCTPKQTTEGDGFDRLKPADYNGVAQWLQMHIVAILFVTSGGLGLGPFWPPACFARWAGE